MASKRKQPRQAARLERCPRRRLSRQGICSSAPGLDRVFSGELALLFDWLRCHCGGRLPRGLWLRCRPCISVVFLGALGLCAPRRVWNAPFPESPRLRHCSSTDRCDRTSKSFAPRFPDALCGVTQLARGDTSSTTGLFIPSSLSLSLPWTTCDPEAHIP